MSKEKNNKTIRKVFLDELPRKEGIGKNKGKQVIDWKGSIGYIVKFIYEDIQGEIKIIDYNKSYLYIEYLNKKHFKISACHFQECKLGNLLNKFTKDFKFKIGACIKDNKRNLTIIDKEYRVKVSKNNKRQNLKWYKYKCNKCRYCNGWIDEVSLIQGIGCSVCCPTPRIIAEGINDIPTTAPWMVKYFQGGYDEAKLYTKNSGKRIHPVCPDCGRIKNKTLRIQDIYIEHSIGCPCGDGISYPEKFIFNILEQLDVNFVFHTSTKNFKWCKNYKYDFYIPSLNSIIETHGEQHYQETTRKGGRTLKEEQENDNLKENLAKENGIEHYIVIDCRESELEFIKNNILSSKLNELFDLSKIHWNKCEEFALNNLVKIVCNYKKNSPNMTVVDISEIIDLSNATVRRYLKRGNELGWCIYNTNEEKRNRNIKGANNSKEKTGKQVEIFKDKISLGRFKNCHELQRQSKSLFKIKLLQGNISRVARKEMKSYKGFAFEYV